MLARKGLSLVPDEDLRASVPVAQHPASASSASPPCDSSEASNIEPLNGSNPTLTHVARNFSSKAKPQGLKAKATVSVTVRGPAFPVMSEILIATFVELRSKNEETRLRASYELRNQVIAAHQGKRVEVDVGCVS